MHGARTEKLIKENKEKAWLSRTGLYVQINEQSMEVLSPVKVTTWKKCWKERENWHQLAAEPRATHALTRGLRSPSQPTRLEQFERFHRSEPAYKKRKGKLLWPGWLAWAAETPR